MSTREHHHRDRETPATPGTPTPDGTTRTAAERLMAHAEEFIARALSQDSAAFLTAARQTGGQ
jgi:hypothetical protein